MQKNKLFELSNVVGYGSGFKNVAGQLTEDYALVVMVNEKLSEPVLSSEDVVPSEFNGQQTDVIQVGNLRALRTSRFRPAPGGVSIGHVDITAGTFGAVVRDVESGSRLILSNNHVLANSNNAKLGDAIYQPGPVDGGTASDHIADLYDYVPINFGGLAGSSSIADILAVVGNFILSLSGDRCYLNVECPEVANLVDAALARPLEDSDVLDEILDIGVVSGTKLPLLGASVRKSGRTTGLTSGTIQLVNAVVNVSYGGGRTARFEEQIITTNISQGGDSGSLLVDGEENVAVGLLFAGSSEVTIHGEIGNVLKLLDVTI